MLKVVASCGEIRPKIPREKIYISRAGSKSSKIGHQVGEDGRVHVKVLKFRLEARWEFLLADTEKAATFES